MFEENVTVVTEEEGVERPAEPAKTVISDDVKPGSPNRLPKVPAMSQEGFYDKVVVPAEVPAEEETELPAEVIAELIADLPPEQLAELLAEREV